MTFLDVQNLSYNYPNGKRVFHDLNMAAKSGEFVVLIGPSGCGKSTLLRLISGLESPTAGRVCFNGKDVSALPARKRNVSMVFQSYALYPHMTVLQNLELALKLAGVSLAERRKRVSRVAGYLEIQDLFTRKPAQLSGGQRQRVAMGRALVREPALFLFDEPLSNLDAELRARLRIQIKRLHQEFPSTKVYVTHDQVEAMTLADRIVVLRDGEVQQIGSPSELYDKPANLFVAQFLGSPAINQLVAELQEGAVHCGGKDTGLRTSLKGIENHVTIAARPEKTQVRKKGVENTVSLGSGSSLCFSGRVVVTENLGAVVHYNVETEVGELRASQRAHGTGEGILNEGEAVEVTFGLADVHVFSNPSGEMVSVSSK